jgi:hypothetical protein
MVAAPPCLLLDIKDLLKEDMRIFFDEGLIDWWAAAAAELC